MSDSSFQGAAAAAAPETGSTAAPATVDTGVADTGVVDNEAPEDQEEVEEKFFTQAELDAKIAKRLAVERRRWDRDQAERANAPRPMVEPKPADFATPTEYIDAAATFKAEQIVAQRDAKKQQSDLSNSYAEREEAAREKYSDYADVAHVDTDKGGPAISREMAEVIMASEIGPEIAYYLGKNVEESKRIWGLKPLAQAAALGKIEASLSAKPVAKPTTNAPDPIKPIGTRTTVSNFSTSDPRSVKDTSVADWIEKRNQEISKRTHR